MTEKEMFEYLARKVGNAFAAAGIMGNLQAESNVEANRKQGDFTKDRTYSKAYTENIDTGKLTEDQFAYDSIGYGLAQWTFWSRKKALYEFAKKGGDSIGDCGMQLDFLIHELCSDYNYLWQQLKVCKSVKEASDLILYQYEKPANASMQSEHRASYAQVFYDKYAGESVADVGADALIRPETRTAKTVIAEICVLLKELGDVLP